MVLVKLNRKPAELEVMDLFRRMDGPESGTLITDPSRVDNFLTKVREGISASLDNPTRVRGWRQQSLFGSLVVALDGCQMMQTVDHGDVFFDGEGVKPPDYVLVLKDGRRMLVEVKSHFVRGRGSQTEPITMRKNEFESLQRYASLLGIDLYIATMLTGGLCLLNKDSDFTLDAKGKKYSVSIPAAAMASEFDVLGDVLLGIPPEIKFELLVDPSKPRKANGDDHEFTIGSVKLSVGGTQITDKVDYQLAWFALLYGEWPDDEHVELNDEGLVEAIVYTSRPEERANPDEDFEIIGRLSQMYCRMFEWITNGEAGVTALDSEPEPGMLPALLPADHMFTQLRLWRFHLSPRPR